MSIYSFFSVFVIPGFLLAFCAAKIGMLNRYLLSTYIPYTSNLGRYYYQINKN